MQWDKKPDTRKTVKPPEIVETLSKLLYGKTLTPLPADPFAAAKAWVNMQEPPHEYRERVEPVYDHEGEIKGFRTPYHDRLSYTLRVFLSLSEANRVYVMDGMQRGIPWRGDAPQSYANIVEETAKMRDNPRGYIQESIKAMKNLSFGG